MTLPIDIHLKKITGIDIEPADREVGIMDDTFILFGIDMKDNNLSISFGGEDMLLLRELVQKYTLKERIINKCKHLRTESCFINQACGTKCLDCGEEWRNTYQGD